MLHASLKCFRFMVYKKYAKLSMKFILLINVKVPTIIDNLSFMSSTASESSKARVIFIFQHLSFYEQLEFYTQLSMKKFYNPKAWHIVYTLLSF